MAEIAKQIRKQRVQDGQQAVYYLPSSLVEHVKASALAEGCTASEIVRRQFGVVAEPTRSVESAIA